MDRKQFWSIVNAAQKESGGDFDRRYRILIEALSDLPPEDIIDFSDIYGELLRESYSWDLWDAAYIINGGCSDDGFMDFRRWLISRGEQAFYGALADPESLALWQEGEDDLFFEQFGWICDEAFGIATGEDFIEALGKRVRRKSTERTVIREPRGTRWKNEDELAGRFPKLYARFWNKER